ncbi:MAG: YfhO family protein [Anaerolineales bacterium]
MNTSRRDWLILGLISLGPMLLFGPMLLRGEVLFWGTPILQFIPWHDFALDVLREGHLPFWNPFSGFGAPLFANYQTALLYPPNFLLYVLGPAYAHGILVMVHLIWAGLGMALLARHLHLPTRGQLVAGVAFSLCGYLVARGSFISINHTAAWLPWIILVSDRLSVSSDSATTRNFISNILVLGVLFGLQWLAGHAQTAWYTLLFSLVWVTWRSLQKGGWADLARNAVGMLAAGALGFVLSAVQLIPTIEYLLQSQRSIGLDREFALTYSFWPWRLVGLLAPGLFGSPASGTYWGYGNYWEDAIYIGVFPLLMAMGAITSAVWRKDERRTLSYFLLATSAVVFFLALGKNTPVFRFLFDNVPTFDLFQAPTRWNLLFVFSLSLLSGIGITHWKTPEGRALYWTRLGTAGAGIIGVASYVGAIVLSDVEATFVPAFARAGLFLFASGLLTLFLKKRMEATVLMVVGAFLLIDMVSAGYGLNPSINQEVFQGQSELSKMVEGTERVYMPGDLEEQIKFEQTHRFDTYSPGVDWRLVREVGLPNTTMLDGIRSANNFDPFTTARFENWMSQINSLEPERQVQFLKLAGVRWQAGRDATGFLDVIYKDLGETTRARLLPRAIPVQSQYEALTKLTSTPFEATYEILIEAEDNALPVGSIGDARIIDQSNPNQVHVVSSSQDGGWLLLSESWYPGWRVFIDGEQTDLYRADYLFMGAWVPAGQHRVEFSYRPTYIIPVALMTALGWLGVVLAAVRLRKR